MDQVKIGAFIARLRRRENLTQEALGEKLGVTNKTVSRWENGNYMPDIETLSLLAGILQVSVQELLAGQALPEEESRRESGTPVLSFAKEGPFSVEARKAYFKRKWRRDHGGLLVFLAAVFLAAAVLPWIFGRPWISCLAPLVGLAEYGWQNNAMMTYVENHLYE